MDIFRIVLSDELKDKLYRYLPEGLIINGIDKVTSSWYEVDYTYRDEKTRVKVDLCGKMLSIHIDKGHWCSIAVQEYATPAVREIRIEDICYLFVSYIGYLAKIELLDSQNEVYRVFSEIHAGNDENFRKLIDLTWDKVIVYTYPKSPDRFCVELVSRRDDLMNLRYYYRSTSEEVTLEHPGVNVKFMSQAFKDNDRTKILRLVRATRQTLQAAENPIQEEVKTA